MAHPVTLIDRLRIERLVWTLDQRLYELPSSSRIAKRREIRDNLLIAARDVGTAEALRRLGGSRRLADEYLDAELGDGPRHSWIAAAYFCLLVPLLTNYFLAEAATSFQQGITAIDPHATGTFAWSGISYLQSAATYTFTDGHGSGVGGAWTPLTYVLLFLGTILAGRLWRLLPSARRRRASAAAH
ncbi:hypothetical protein Cs7R123_08120 [Catellatospora sp. TT07R-123]|uniref:hypothetical protein n=1 Tax=Catellatospora sp. TT07R-123 TaxID=2733863 RepID=UPI001B2A05ED|nr:hypothetical protein [Catellatospora sp. TT07R-123]GHJ43470.1 hypothetical protein Cs7R123_08120 [Catellatospora sp. TT07R-123]